MCVSQSAAAIGPIVTVGWLPNSFEVILAISPVINSVGSFVPNDPTCVFTGVRVAIGCHIHLKFLAICPFMNRVLC